MMPDLPLLKSEDQIVSDSGKMTSLFQRWMRIVVDNDLIIGTGSPEGVVEGGIGQQYMDKNGSTGSILYIKKLPDIGGDRKQGWIAV